MLDRQFTKNWPIIFPSLLHQFSCYSIHKGKIIHHWFCKSIQRFFPLSRLEKWKKREKLRMRTNFPSLGKESFSSLGQNIFHPWVKEISIVMKNWIGLEWIRKTSNIICTKVFFFSRKMQLFLFCFVSIICALDNKRWKKPESCLDRGDSRIEEGLFL